MAENVQIGDWEGAIEYSKEILEILEELPEAADEFRVGVEERVLDMMKWIEENKHVTESQIVALENMMGGAKKWRRE
jgi:hypothetical protein